MTSELLNKIYFEYRKELFKNGLKESKATDMFNTIKKYQRQVTIIKTIVNCDDTLMEEIEDKNKGRNDWLKQNPNMAYACKINGIKKSSELRDLIYKYWEVQNG